MVTIEQKTVAPDEGGMRLDRWFKAHYPGLGFAALQKLLRTGQVRLDGKRAKAETRVEPGQTVRVPPLAAATSQPMTMNTVRSSEDGDALSRMILYEDDKVYVFNKPAGLATQGGSGLTRHVDGMLEAFRSKKGEKPRLVHRLDRDTSGVLVVARTKGAARELAEAFRKRDTRKLYWAIVKGVPKPHEGRLSTWLVKEQTPDGDKMRIAKHGEPDADHAVSAWRTIENVGQRLSWLELQPETGRTHQLRIHMLHNGTPIIGDPKYFEEDPNWEFPGGIQKKLHLHARRLVIPNPAGGTLDITAPLPAHMVQTFNLLGLEEADGDRD